MAAKYLDLAQSVRTGEEIGNADFYTFLNETLSESEGDIEILQFPGGYSNLTYLIKKGSNEFVLRKPPLGANIKSAHDMGREFRVLSLLKPVYDKIPQPICYYEETDLLGSPFYLMQRVNGLILRNEIPSGLKIDQNSFRKLSIDTIDNLVKLHQLELKDSELITLGRPENYVLRQVEGWVKRYFNAETDEIIAMNETACWMQENVPAELAASFIHNDYKYDNLVLEPDTLEIKALLDWEMATVGDPFMDLGTTLGYWAEADDPPALKSFGLTAREGNLNRQELAERYAATRKCNLDNLVFYYVFGCFKIGVIAQQIYARFKKGFSKDSRFAGLIHVTRACAENAEKAIKYNRISNFK